MILPRANTSRRIKGKLSLVTVEARAALVAPVPFVDWRLVAIEFAIAKPSRIVSRQQPIYTLSRYLPVSIWEQVERQLEENNFLLRDPIGELISQEQWSND